jgi:hypothetical protein
MGKAIDLLSKLEVVQFEWKHSGITEIGMIAEEVEKIIPEAVWYKEGKVEGLKPLVLISVLVEAIRELKEEINGRNNLTKST